MEMSKTYSPNVLLDDSFPLMWHFGFLPFVQSEKQYLGILIQTFDQYVTTDLNFDNGLDKKRYEFINTFTKKLDILMQVTN